MSTVFSSIITPQSLIFTDPDGKMHTITSAHVNHVALRETLKEALAARARGDAEVFAELHRRLAEMAEPARAIVEASKGRVEVRDGTVFYAGEAVHNAITDRILSGIREGFDMGSYIAFLDKLMANPSRRAVTELYGFLEANRMGITEDGHLIAYKRVRDDFRDIHSGKFDNSPGQILEMARNKVDDDKDRTCSYGFHFCSMSYLPYFGAGPGSRIVLVKVNPADVVSIPADYNNAKARCCRYEVVSEYTGSDCEDLLASKAVWSEADWREYEDYEGAFDQDEDEDCWEYNDSDLDDADDYIREMMGSKSTLVDNSTADHVDDEDDAPSDNFHIFQKAPFTIWRGHNLVSVEYTNRPGQSFPTAVLVWDNGWTTVAQTQPAIEAVDEQLRHQASFGNRARITIKTI